MISCVSSDNGFTDVSIVIVEAATCSAGQGPSINGGCEECSEGKYSSSTFVPCTPCPAGTHSRTRGATSADVCVSCGSEESSVEGSSSCRHIEDVDSFVLRGMCSEKKEFDGAYTAVAFTKSGRAWFQNENGKALYWDRDCDGEIDGEARWIVDSDEPSATAESDLDGEFRQKERLYCTWQSLTLWFLLVLRRR